MLDYYTRINNIISPHHPDKKMMHFPTLTDPLILYSTFVTFICLILCSMIESSCELPFGYQESVHQVSATSSHPKHLDWYDFAPPLRLCIKAKQIHLSQDKFPLSLFSPCTNIHIQQYSDRLEMLTLSITDTATVK